MGEHRLGVSTTTPVVTGRADRSTPAARAPAPRRSHGRGPLPGGDRPATPGGARASPARRRRPAAARRSRSRPGRPCAAGRSSGPAARRRAGCSRSRRRRPRGRPPSATGRTVQLVGEQRAVGRRMLENTGLSGSWVPCAARCTGHLGRHPTPPRRPRRRPPGRVRRSPRPAPPRQPRCSRGAAPARPRPGPLPPSQPASPVVTQEFATVETPVGTAATTTGPTPAGHAPRGWPGHRRRRPAPRASSSQARLRARDWEAVSRRGQREQGVGGSAWRSRRTRRTCSSVGPRGARSRSRVAWRSTRTAHTRSLIIIRSSTVPSGPRLPNHPELARDISLGTSALPSACHDRSRAWLWSRRASLRSRTCSIAEPGSPSSWRARSASRRAPPTSAAISGSSGGRTRRTPRRLARPRSTASKTASGRPDRSAASRSTACGPIPVAEAAVTASTAPSRCLCCARRRWPLRTATSPVRRSSAAYAVNARTTWARSCVPRDRPDAGGSCRNRSFAAARSPPRAPLSAATSSRSSAIRLRPASTGHAPPIAPRPARGGGTPGAWLALREQPLPGVDGVDQSCPQVEQVVVTARRARPWTRRASVMAAASPPTPSDIWPGRSVVDQVTPGTRRSEDRGRSRECVRRLGAEPAS